MLTVDVSDFTPAELEQQAKEKTEDILSTDMQSIMDSIFIPEVKRVAAAANVPQGFIDGIKFVQIDDMRGKLVNTWGTQEKPLALWFNYGTKDHGALGNWPLHWIDKVTGEDIYAMHVRGVPKTLAMEIGFAMGIKRLKREVPRYVEARVR